MRRIASIVMSAVTLALCGLAAGCGAAADTHSDRLKVGAYSVVKEVFDDGVLPAFAAEWKRRTGRDVTFGCSPENLRLGRAIEVFNDPGRVVVGLSDQRADSWNCRLRHHDRAAIRFDSFDGPIDRRYGYRALEAVHALAFDQSGPDYPRSICPH